MEEKTKNPAKPCETSPLTKRRKLSFTVVKVSILVILIMLCAVLKQLGRMQEGECIWVRDLCTVITDVSLALLKGDPVEGIAIMSRQRKEEENTVNR